MKRFLVVVGIAATMGLLGVAAVWACCGGGYVLEVTGITAEPDPVPCEGTVEIDYTIAARMTTENQKYMLMTQQEILDGTTTIWDSGEKYLGDIGSNADWPVSFSWTPGTGGGGKTYGYRISAWTEDTQGGTTISVIETGSFTTEPCCVEGIWLEVTPQTFDVTRAGVPVKAHVVLPPGASMLTGGKIIEIGGIPTSIPGTASPDTNLTFSSEAFSAVAAIIVPAGKPRAKDVPVLIDVDLADPDVQPCDKYYKDTVDIINEGKGKKK